MMHFGNSTKFIGISEMYLGCWCTVTTCQNSRLPFKSIHIKERERRKLQKVVTFSLIISSLFIASKLPLITFSLNPFIASHLTTPPFLFISKISVPIYRSHQPNTLSQQIQHNPTMGKTLHFLSSLLLLLVILFQITSAFKFPSNEQPLSLNSDFPSREADKLIRQLNLFPKDAHPVKSQQGLQIPDRIVEKRLKFPNFQHSGISVDDLGHHAGYYKLQHSYDARMFYFFFESRTSKKDPVVIWLTGGPGCSSELAVFYENGPFTIANNMSLLWNEYGWDKASNLLYVDQPTGTGFSYSSDKRDLRHNEEGVSNDLYDFLQAFFAKHPEYAKNEFYITGESYAGHYIPAFAARVHQGNKAKEGIPINLKGFAIGNGLTDPAVQYKAYTDYALDMKIIQESDYKSINRMLPACELAIKICGTDGKTSCMASYLVCTSIFNKIMNLAGDKNYYDIRKKCEGSLCYDFSNMEKFLNQKSVRDALGVGNIDFVSCSPTVYEAMLMDWMRNLEVGIPALLEDGIQMLIYAGEYDLICNWLGNSRWVHAMEWSGQKNFVGSPTTSFLVDGAEAGELKSHGPLSFLKVHDAGHMVPMDQPKAALEMLKRWTTGKLAAEPEDRSRIADM